MKTLIVVCLLQMMFLSKLAKAEHQEVQKDLSIQERAFAPEVDDARTAPRDKRKVKAWYVVQMHSGKNARECAAYIEKYIWDATCERIWDSDGKLACYFFHPKLASIAESELSSCIKKVIGPPKLYNEIFH